MVSVSKGLTRADILSIPEVLEEVRADLLQRRRELMAVLQENARSRVLLVGCGSSYCVALYGQFLIRRYTQLHATAIPCTDLLCFPQLYLREDMPLSVILISRSGTTTETVLACDRLRERGNVKVYSVTCSAESTLTRMATPLFAFGGSADAATPMTRSLLSFCYLFAWLAASHATDGDLTYSLDVMPEQMAKCLKEHDPVCESVAGEPGIRRYLMLGGGPLMGVARDGALKFNELCALPATHMPPMEYVHGSIAAAGPDQMVFLLASDGGARYEEYVLHRLAEIQQPTTVLSATAASLAPGFRCLDLSPYVGGNDFVSGLYYAPLMMLTAVHKAMSLGLDPDVPRHIDRALHLPPRR